MSAVPRTLTTMDTHLTPRFVRLLAGPAVLAAIERSEVVGNIGATVSIDRAVPAVAHDRVGDIRSLGIGAVRR